MNEKLIKQYKDTFTNSIVSDLKMMNLPINAENVGKVAKIYMEQLKKNPYIEPGLFPFLDTKLGKMFYK